MDDVFLPPDSQRRLLQVARQTLEEFVRGAERHVKEISDPSLQSCDYGAFVSLHNQQTLRGCVGNCAPNARLFEVVIEMTEAAASRDGRMAPVSADELDDIRIDITVLYMNWTRLQTTTDTAVMAGVAYLPANPAVAIRTAQDTRAFAALRVTRSSRHRLDLIGRPSR